MSDLNIYQRFIQVQKQVRSVVKNDTIKMSATDKGYKAVSHDDVAALLHLPLAEAGIVMLPDVVDFSTTEFEVEKPGYNGKPGYIQRWYRTDLKIMVKWINADKPDDFFSSTGAAFALDTSDKSFAKAYSLALKIVLLKVHLLESRDEEEKRTFEADGEGELKPRQQAKPKDEKQDIPFTKPVQKNDLMIPIGPVLKPDPANFIMPMGNTDVLGRKLIEIPPSKLKHIKTWCEGEIKKTPPHDKIETIKVIYQNVNDLLNSVGV